MAIEKHGENDFTVLVRLEDASDARSLIAAIDEAESALAELADAVDFESRTFLQFDFEMPDGDRLEDGPFFERACEHERVRERTAEFLRAYHEWSERFPDNVYVFRTLEKPTLFRAAAQLAMSDVQYVPLFLAVMRNTTLDHEVNQGAWIEELVDEHGWTPEIEELLLARFTDAWGIYGLDEVEYYADFLREHLPEPRHESPMFDGFLAYYRTLAEDDRGVEEARNLAERHGEPLLDDDEYDAWMKRVDETLPS